MSGERTPTNQRTARAARLERLRALLADQTRAWSRAELAAELGVSAKTLSNDLGLLGERGDFRRSRRERQERLRGLLAGPEGEALSVEELAGRLDVDPATISYDLRALGVPDRRSGPVPAEERQAKIRALIAEEPELRAYAVAQRLQLPTTTVYRDFRALGLLQAEDEPESVPA